MGKKKRQRNPNSPESSDVDSFSMMNGSNLCSHVTKAISLTSIKKVLKGECKLGFCSQCKKLADESQLPAEETTIWMCLQCGHQGCGRYSENKHGLAHYKTPRSFSHAVTVCVGVWNVWCYDCDDEVPLESNKKLQECVEYIKKQSAVTNNKEKESSCVQLQLTKEEDGILSSKLESLKVNSEEHKIDKADVKSTTDNQIKCNVRGLNNLGNTCFFNAVMQNICRSNYLFELLEGHSSSGVELSLDPGHVKLADNRQIHLDSLNFRLQEAGPITKAADEILKEMRSSTKIGSVNPSTLFSHICKKAPQFRGFRQQDSHELLRHLLDGIRSEEVKRMKAAVLKEFNVGGKTNAENLDEDIKQKIKYYGRAGNQVLVDRVFGGQLISTVVCEECHMSSQVFEPFLDLSLPVSEEKPLRPNLQHKVKETCSVKSKNETPSKYQDKKQKQQLKKEAKRKAKQDKVAKRTISLDDDSINQTTAQDDVIVNGIDKNTSDTSDSEKLDADVEDNGDTSSVKEILVNDNEDEEWPDINGERCRNKNDDDNEADDVPAADINDLSAKVKGMRIRRKSQSADSLLPEEMDNADASFEVLESSALMYNDADDSDDDKGIQEEWKARSLSSLAPRYHCSSHECSIQSCLNQFTAAELLTGSNKFGCENCTKLKADKSNKSGEKIETVYSIANKQLLLFSPPAILTLHLKRFQQIGYTLKKINRHVTFPLILDLAPFCSSICLGLPTLHPGQRNILYSLYGVVEHSGRLSGGHYTAAVKVRDKDDGYKTFLNNMFPGQYEIDCLVKQMAKKSETKESSKLPSDNDLCSSNGKWFHISDSFVREISVDTVLKTQAYLLFYERVF